MSYDIDLMADTGGEPVSIWSRNHTSNTACMWRAAGIELRDYHGGLASALRGPAHDACVKIIEEQDRYKKMEPGNGWGTVASTILFLTDIANACTRYPKTTVEVSY